MSIIDIYGKTYEDHVRNKRQKKDGTILMTGQTIEEAINNPYQRDAWEKNADRVKEQNFSKTLQGNNQGINTVIGFGRGLHESLAGLGALLPNDFMPGKGELFKDVFTYENLSKGKVPYKVDEQYLGEELAKIRNVADVELTEEDLAAAQKYVDEKGLAPGFGKGLAFVSEFFVGLGSTSKAARAKQLLKKTNRTSAEDLELEKLVTMYAKPTQASISKKINTKTKTKTNIDEAIADVRKEAAKNGEILTEKEIIEQAAKNITFPIKADKAGKELVDMFGKRSTDYGLEKDLGPKTINKKTTITDINSTDPDFISYTKRFNNETKTLTNQKLSYKSYINSKNDFLNNGFSETQWQLVDDFILAQKKAGKKPAHKDYSNTAQKYFNNPPIDEFTGKPFTFDQWMSPKKLDGTLHSNPDKQRKRMEIGAAEWNSQRNAVRNSTLDGLEDISKAQVNRLFNSMKRNSIGPDRKFAAKKDGQGKVVGYEVIDPSEPGYGNIYYKSGYTNKRNITGKNVFDIKEHPTWQTVDDMINAAKEIKHGSVDPNIAKEIFDVVGDFTTYGAKNKPFTVNTLGDYLFKLDAFKDPSKANLSKYKSLGQKNLIEIHHTKGVKTSATDPSFLQAASQKDNAAGNKIIAQFNENIKTLPLNKVLNIAKKQVKDFPTLKLDITLADGEVITLGNKLNTQDVVNMVKKDIATLYNKHLKGKPEEIKKMVDQLKTIGNAMGGNPIPRTYYADGDQDPDDPASDIYTGIAFPDFGSIKGAQDRIIETYKDSQLPETIESLNKNFAKPVQIKAENVLTESRKIMNKGDRPLELRPLQDGFELISDNPIVEAAIASPWTAYNALLNISGAMYNAVADKDIDVEKEFPYTFKMQKAITGGAGKTPDDQDYISFVDELNRAQETGMAKLSYSIVDLLASIPDLTIETELRDKIQKSYNRAVDSGELVTKPETFLGEIGSVMVEFGMPGTQVLKGVNFLRRAIKSSTGFNLFTRGSYATNRLLGASKSTAAAITAGNVAKRVGVGSMVFAGTDFIAGGPYNTVTEMMPDDPLFFDQTVGYDYIDTEGLSGRDLTVANFKNRLRFAADGAIVGGLFPLVGPALWQATKYGAIKPGAYVLGKGAKIADTLAVKPASYLASGKIKVPFTKPGTYEATIPGVQTLSQGLGGGAKIFGDFLGSDVLARLAVKGVSLGSVGLKAARETLSPKSVGFQGFDPVAETGIIKQLPDFKDWRMFDVTDSDPLKANLKKIDNVFSIFRDVGKKSSNQYYVETKAQQKIKGVNREVEKYIDAIEQKAFDLAKGFENRYNTNKTSPAGEEYLVEQVLSAIKGQIKITDLPKELQTLTKELDKLLDKIKLDYADILPDSGLKDYIGQNLKEYLRQSFATFTNPQYRPSTQVFDNAVEFIADIVRKNENLLEEAQRTNVNTNEAVRIYATKIVEDILSVGKTDGKDPLMQLSFIAKRKLQDDDLSASIKTGEELPDVIKQLLGEENSLRSAVMQTTSSLVTQTQNLKAYNRVADILLKEGRLFNSAEEAIGANVRNALPVSRVPGIGLLDAKINQLYGSPEIIRALQSSAGPLDKLAQNEIIQLLIAYKAGVQTAKTVLSPATQSRNFGSATAFVLNNGWIGGRASVTDSFKIVLDDIFGAGRTANEEDLIKYISRQTELGVIDENIVASELTAVLNDIKSGKISTTAGLIDKIDSTNFMKTATRLYAGGDNVWKLYSHEYLKSMFKGAFKDIDEVKRNVKIDFGIDEFNPATMAEAIEEYAALTVRELMPTYSKVPPAIQAIRKIPFIGNFVSFPAEILRTSVATSSLALKHIASDNQVLRELGYRSLLGQAVTLYGINEGAKGLAHAMTDISPNMIQTYKDYFGPEYMKYSELVPISNMDEKGAFKVFDMSRYNPYDLVTATAQNLIRRATNPQSTLDPDKIETDVLQEYLKVFGPLPGLLSGTFFGLSISTESFMEAVTGNKKQGGKVYGDKDTIIEKLDKSFMHWANKIEPGAVSSIQKIYGAFAGDVDSQGVPLDLSDELFKLSGGSTVPINVPASFSFKISEFQDTFKDALVSESFYSTKNYQSRGPAQLVREYNKFNEEAFREQYKFYAAVRQALDSNLMTRSQIIRALKERKLSDKVVVNVLNGKFTPLSTREGGLKGRYNKIKKGNPDQIFSRSDFMPMGALERAKNKWGRIKFEDFETERKEPEQVSIAPVETPQVNQTVQAAPPVAPLPASGAVQVAETQPATGPVNEATGLTGNETALLNRDEQLIRQRQRGIV